jgi:hypothetical protein
MKNLDLQEAGYPLQADDLTLEEWLDLWRVKQVVKPSVMCPLMRNKKNRQS